MKEGLDIPKGFIFDMDGTLLDTNGLWWELPRRLLEKEGITCPEALRAGLDVEDCGSLTQKLWEAGVFPWEAEEIWRRYYKIMDQLYSERAVMVRGAEAFLQQLQALGLPCCVATATALDTAQIALHKAGVPPYLRFAVSCKCLGMNKSNPAFFEQVAGRLGLDIRDCVVVEDALYAMKGAKAAGATVWAIWDRWTAGDWAEIGKTADRHFENYAQMAAALEECLPRAKGRRPLDPRSMFKAIENPVMGERV